MKKTIIVAVLSGMLFIPASIAFADCSVTFSGDCDGVADVNTYCKTAGCTANCCDEACKTSACYDQNKSGLPCCNADRTNVPCYDPDYAKVPCCVSGSTVVECSKSGAKPCDPCVCTPCAKEKDHCHAHESRKAPVIRTYNIENEGLYNRLKGKIILKVEQNGEAYYVSPNEHKVYFLGNSVNGLKILQMLGTGASDATLIKILAGAQKVYGPDSDMDGLSDDYEYAFGSNPNNFNSDRDTYSDYTEITHGYDPNGSGTLPINTGLTWKLKGRVLLQVESMGESWYINPIDGKRYLLSNEYEMGDMIRKSGLGISNHDFSRLVK